MSVVSFIVIRLVIINTLIEIFLLHNQIYAYPAAMRAISLFEAQTYRFPLSEGLPFGGFWAGATALLSYFRDETCKTQTGRHDAKTAFHHCARRCYKETQLIWTV